MLHCFHVLSAIAGSQGLTLPVTPKNIVAPFRRDCDVLQTRLGAGNESIGSLIRLFRKLPFDYLAIGSKHEDLKESFDSIRVPGGNHLAHHSARKSKMSRPAALPNFCIC